VSKGLIFISVLPSKFMVIKKLDQMQLDKLTIKLYTEFQENNKILYKTNPQEYFHKQFDYVQKRLQEIVYLGKD
jgi:hypothetical protein